MAMVDDLVDEDDYLNLNQPIDKHRVRNEQYINEFPSSRRKHFYSFLPLIPGASPSPEEAPCLCQPLHRGDRRLPQQIHKRL